MEFADRDHRFDCVGPGKVGGLGPAVRVKPSRELAQLPIRRLGVSGRQFEEPEHCLAL